MNEKEIGQCDEIAKEICARLREIRESKGISKNRLAEGAGLSWAAVMRIEKGERMPSLNTLIRLCRALEVDLSSVIKEFEE